MKLLQKCIQFLKFQFQFSLITISGSNSKESPSESSVIVERSGRFHQVALPSVFLFRRENQRIDSLSLSRHGAHLCQIFLSGTQEFVFTVTRNISLHILQESTMLTYCIQPFHACCNHQIYCRWNLYSYSDSNEFAFGPN